MNFLLNTRIGQAIILAVVILGCWIGFRAYYVNVGVERCRNEQARAVGKSNVELIDAERRRDSISSTVAAESNERSAAQDKQIADKTASRQETVRNEYAKPTASVDAALGCVGVAPVPAPVQADIEAAVKEINDAR